MLRQAQHIWQLWSQDVFILDLKVVVWEINLKVKFVQQEGNHFHKEVMISLKFEKDQYNAFINDDKTKVMCKIDDLNPVTSVKGWR